MASREHEPIREHISVPRPLTAVFRALTDSDEVAGWFGEDAYIELLEGGRYEVLSRHGWKRGRISQIQNDRLLIISWPLELEEDREEPTTIAFHLEPQGESTLVSIEHSGILNAEDWATAYQELQTGWPATLTALRGFLEGKLKGKQRTLLP